MKTAVIFNSNFYGQVRNWALGDGRACQRTDAGRAWHPRRLHRYQGARVGSDGTQGPEAGLDFMRFLEDGDVRFCHQRLDVCPVSRLRGDRRRSGTEILFPHLDRPKVPRYARIFDRSKCENVVTSRADWTNLKELGDECPLDMGDPYCYWGSDESRALVDPAWINGPHRCIKRAKIKTVVFMHYEPNAPAVEKFSPQDALEYVTAGQYRTPDGAGMSPFKKQPFFNPIG